MATRTPNRNEDLTLDLGDDDDISSMRLRTPTFKSAELQTPRFDDFGELPELLPMMEPESSEVRLMAQPPEVDRTLVQQMLNAFSGDDHATALELAEAILATNPELVVVQSCAKECRIELAAANLRRIGGPEGVLLVAGTPSELSAAGITHREGFLLSQIDGVLTNEELLDVCGMDGTEALRILAKLVGSGILCQA